MAETIFQSTYTPDPANTIDVLAFVLTPARVFADSDDPEEIAAIECILAQAKVDAISRWSQLNKR